MQSCSLRVDHVSALLDTKSLYLMIGAEYAFKSSFNLYCCLQLIMRPVIHLNVVGPMDYFCLVLIPLYQALHFTFTFLALL